MTDTATVAARLRDSIDLLAKVPPSLVQLVLRFGLAGIFWSSGRTKVEGLLTISESTYFLFEEEYPDLCLPGCVPCHPSWLVRAGAGDRHRRAR